MFRAYEDVVFEWTVLSLVDNSLLSFIGYKHIRMMK